MSTINHIEIKKERTLFDDKVQMVIGFLQQHYDIRVPVQDPGKIQITCKDKQRYAFPPSFDDVSLHLLSEGYSIGDTTLRKIIRSPNCIAPVNPITSYFDSIRGSWKGRSHIDILCEHISPRYFDDNTEDFYRKRTDRLIRKWLVACVACWVGGIPNDVAFGLIQSQGGAGKTFLAKFLLPACLSEFYVQSQKDEKNFTIEHAFTRFMVVNFDELNGLNKYSINNFKAALSDNVIETKYRHEEFPTKKPRIGCAVFSTNYNAENGGFIHYYYGSDTRRFGCIEITDINQDYSRLVDINQLWAEALTLYESPSFDYLFSKVDYEDFNRYNARYRFEREANKYVQLYIAKPEHPDDGEKLTVTEIYQRLVHEKKIKAQDFDKIDHQKLGAALIAEGYRQIPFRSKTHDNAPRKGYHVKFIG